MENEKETPYTLSSKPGTASRSFKAARARHVTTCTNNFFIERLPETIDILPDAAFAVDRDGRVIAWNRAIEALTGVPKAKILGRAGYAYEVPFHGKARPGIIDAAMGAGSIVESHYTGMEKYGDICFAEVFCPCLDGGRGAFLWAKASPFYDSEGNILGAVECIRDLTGRKKNEETLSSSEKKYRETVENANSIVFRMDPEGTITFANAFAGEFFGYKESEILGRNAFETIIPERDAYGRRLSGLAGEIIAAPEKFANSENENIRRSGERVWIAWSYTVLYDENGGVGEILCIGNDISGRRHMEDVLRDRLMQTGAEHERCELEEKYRLIFEHTPLGVFHFDSNGVVTACNDKIIEIWGSTKEKFLGFNLLSSLKNKKMKSAVKTCLSGRSACYEGVYLSVTGGKISYLKADYGPILSSRGAVTGGIGLIEDISERKQAEESLHEAEGRLRLLASQLITTQENECKRIARELNDTIGYILNDIKFNVENALELAKQSKLNAESLRSIGVMVQHAIEQSKRLSTDLYPSMLDDLGLLFTIHLFMKQFQTVYPEIVPRMQVRVEEEEIPEYLKVVIFRVMQEALQNIVAHSRAKAVGITLERAGNILCLEIEDNGRGFDPSALSGKKGGFFSMKERAELAGGKVTIESGQDIGTLIRVRWECVCNEIGGNGSLGDHQPA